MQNTKQKYQNTRTKLMMIKNLNSSLNFFKLFSSTIFIFEGMMFLLYRIVLCTSVLFSLIKKKKHI